MKAKLQNASERPRRPSVETLATARTEPPALAEAESETDTAAPDRDVSPCQQIQGEAEVVSFRGFLDGFDRHWVIGGWVHSLHTPQERLTVELREGDTRIAADVAERFRDDLLEAQIGDGKHAFRLVLPPDMFDGKRHLFSVIVTGVRGPNLLGSLTAHLPRRAPAGSHAGQGSSRTASAIVASVISTDPAAAADLATWSAEVTAAASDICDLYDQVTALELLYIHILRRRADAHGLHSRIKRLNEHPDQLDAIVFEIAASDEARQVFRANAGCRFPSLAPLLAWAQLRRPAWQPGFVVTPGDQPAETEMPPPRGKSSVKTAGDKRA